MQSKIISFFPTRYQVLHNLRGIYLPPEWICYGLCYDLSVTINVKKKFQFYIQSSIVICYVYNNAINPFEF